MRTGFSSMAARLACFMVVINCVPAAANDDSHQVSLQRTTSLGAPLWSKTWQWSRAGAKESKVTLSNPLQPADHPLAVDPNGETLSVSVTAEPKLLACILTLQHRSLLGQDRSVTLQAQTSDPQKYRGKMEVEHTLTLDRLRPGLYDVGVAVVPANGTPFQLVLGTVQVPSQDPSTYLLPQGYRYHGIDRPRWDHSHAMHWEPLPVITHTFRPPPKQPPMWISLLFSGVVLSPWVLLMWMWSAVGVNGSGFPASSVESIPALAFLGGLCAFVVALYLYWVRLNIFQAMALMAPILLWLLLSGQHFLRRFQIHVDG